MFLFTEVVIKHLWSREKFGTFKSEVVFIILGFDSEVRLYLHMICLHSYARKITKCKTYFQKVHAKYISYIN